MSSFQELSNLGQSIWYDNIQRRLLLNGELSALIDRGEINGITSNPSIFHNAITKSNDYREALVTMAWAGLDAESIFWNLAIDDIQSACDMFVNTYQLTNGDDGYVSLEVHPDLADDAEATLVQAKQLWTRVNRPNLMIKIPATRAGLDAIRSAISQGINVNVTLIFSIDRYKEVMDAYLEGVESLAKTIGSSARRNAFPASVASFFISRMDTLIDNRLPKNSPLRGKAAIANARLAYQAFLETFRGPRWESLAAKGARFQRPLWASTSTKNPDYPDTLYVDQLIGRNSVNTVPPQTLEAFRDHGRVEETITKSVEDARRTFKDLEGVGISLQEVTSVLEVEGVKAFQKAFSEMLQGIEHQRIQAKVMLGNLDENVNQQIKKLEINKVPERLWNGDPTLWTMDPAGQVEIQKRLGWLRLPVSSRSRIAGINAVADEVKKAGIRKILLLGMGGSSLAPEVMSLVFRSDEDAPVKNGIQFAILDSTDPAQVNQASLDFPPHESIYIVSSKSGGTAEVSAMLEHFWHLSGKDASRFIAITDPGTPFAKLASERSFFKIFLADPTVGGRFSVLADFGLLPMALMGMNLTKVLDSAEGIMKECRQDASPSVNPGLVLGAILGEAVLSGRDKLTIISDPQVTSFGSWLEQLIAESSGKDGKGIVVIDNEPVGTPEEYGNDRLFVYLRTSGQHEVAMHELREAGHPVFEFVIPDRYKLVAEFYRWEIATSIACHILGVNAYDQPDVQDNKERTKNKIVFYKQASSLDEGQPILELDNIKVYSADQELVSDKSVMGLDAFLDNLLGSCHVGSYVAINAYLPRNEHTGQALEQLRIAIRRKTSCATTVGFGPRFLHSTGQLHKGGPASGVFIQITADTDKDLQIPGEGFSFGILERAQALGDYEALVNRGRKVIRLNMPSLEYLDKIIGSIK